MDDENNKIIDEETENTAMSESEAGEILESTMERVGELDPEIRKMLLGEVYPTEFKTIVDKYNLTPEQIEPLEQNTSMVLLCMVRPSEYVEMLKKEIPNISPEVLNGVVLDIKKSILTNEILNKIEEAWAEDDENEEIFHNAVEMKDVPLPPEQQIKPIKEYRGEDYNQSVLDSKIANTVSDTLSAPEDIRPMETSTMEKTASINRTPSADRVTWEDRLAVTVPKEPTVSERKVTDTSLPKINSNASTNSNDSYREKVEE